MARLQDFPTVSPTSSDKLLVVQSQSQGLVPYGSKLDSANPTGTGKLSLNRKASTTEGAFSVALGSSGTASGYASFAINTSTVASGNHSFAQGSESTASGTGSHAENNSTASGTYSHSEGSGTTASADYSHSEGNGTTGSGVASHAEGYGSTASGSASHAEGRSTIANHWSQHTFGAYNVADPSTADASSRGNYIEIVGKGTADNARSNARTLDWNGNEVLAGDLTINGNASLTEHIGSVITQVIRGGTRWQLARTSEGTLNSPLSVLIHGYKCLYIASTVSTSSAISDLVSIYSGDTGATITLSSGVLQMGTDGNRQYVCIMPNTVKLVQVTT